MLVNSNPQRSLSESAIESTTNELRHKLKNLFDLLGNSFSYNTKDNLKDSRSELVGKQFGYLLSEIDQIIESNVDTHKKVLDELAQHINNTLYKLQYPNDCNNRRLLVCYVGFCLHISTSSNRTLVLENDGSKWYYSAKWADVFEQLTNCEYEKHVRPYLPLSKYKSIDQKDKVLLLRRRFEIEWEFKIPHSPEIAPLEFKEILTEHHTNPPAWFMGQKWIDFWYNSEEIKIQNSKLNSKKQQNKTLNKRRLFIATDEPKTIIEELRKSWGSQYELLHNKINASYGNRYYDPQRRSEKSLLAIFAEIRTLAKCRFVVCTFSSNVCRLVYELMQAYRGYAGDNVYSIDYDYAEYWYNKEMISTSDYKAKNKDEIDALEGDIISEVILIKDEAANFSVAKFEEIFCLFEQFNKNKLFKISFPSLNSSKLFFEVINDDSILSELFLVDPNRSNTVFCNELNLSSCSIPNVGIDVSLIHRFIHSLFNDENCCRQRS
uniref:GT23 domain-containing protein n=1 Tax=Meloidogyne floridensis TaxID=298350 RepID=A0A915NTJ3_9BILA